MQNKINATELQGMVGHWLHTPPNGYLGSDYGSDLHALLLKPQASGVADSFIDKMKDDIPLVGALGNGVVNVYAQTEGNDKQRIFVEVAGADIAVPDRIA